MTTRIKYSDFTKVYGVTKVRDSYDAESKTIEIYTGKETPDGNLVEYGQEFDYLKLLAGGDEALVNHIHSFEGYENLDGEELASNVATLKSDLETILSDKYGSDYSVLLKYFA